VGARIAAMRSFGMTAKLSNVTPAARRDTGFMPSITSSASARCSTVRSPITSFVTPISSRNQPRNTVVNVQ
jgi:hypothetical protein